MEGGSGNGLSYEECQGGEEDGKGGEIGISKNRRRGEVEEQQEEWRRSEQRMEGKQDEGIWKRKESSGGTWIEGKETPKKRGDEVGTGGECETQESEQVNEDQDRGGVEYEGQSRQSRERGDSKSGMICGECREGDDRKGCEEGEGSKDEGEETEGEGDMRDGRS